MSNNNNACVELSYVWVKSYRNIKNKGFCFSKRWDIYVDDNNELVIKKNLASKKSPFYNKNIDFRILAGKNGCGKSNLLDLLGTDIGICNNNDKSTPYCESDEFIMLYVNCDTPNKSSGAEIPIYFEAKLNNVVDCSWLSNCHNIHVYQNNIISNYKGEYSFETKKINLTERRSDFPSNSTCKIKTIAEQSIVRDGQYKDYSYSSFGRQEVVMPINGYADKYCKLCEYNSILKTDFDMIFKNIEFRLYFNNKVKLGHLSNYGEIIFNQISRDLTEFEYLFGEKIISTNNTFNSKQEFLKSLLSNLIMSLYINNKESIDNLLRRSKYSIFDEINDNKPNDFGELLFKVLLYFMSNLYNHTGNSTEPAEVSCMKRLYGSFKELDEKYYDDYEIVINITDKPADQVTSILGILDEYKLYGNDLNIGKHTSITEYDLISEIKYDFFYLSDGERQFLNIISAIGTACSGIFKGTKNLILLFDEPDNSMHPEAARNFINKLYLIITGLLSFKDVNFQVIIATHSPFLLSDVPSSNIIRMKKDAYNGDCIVKNNMNNKTFGANIHTILAENFFMDSTIGKFAEEYINKLITAFINYEDKTMPYDKYTSLKDKISIVGEDIIRSRLLSLLEEKCSPEDSINSKINRLKQELVKLEAEKAHKDENND